MADENKQIDPFLDGETFTRDVWISHPSLVDDIKKVDPETNRPVGAVKQVVTLDFSGVTKQQCLAKMGATYIIKYQNQFARKDLKWLQNGKGKTIDNVTIKIVDMFAGRVKMSDGERLTNNIGKCTDIDTLRNSQEVLANKIKEIEARNK